MARVLFIDDDPLTLLTLTKAVELYGHRPVIAHSAAQGLQVASEQAPDVIFIDLNLQDMDGLALLRALHAQASTAGIPILVLSADPESLRAEEAREAGARAYLSKPIRLQTLLDAIAAYVAR